MRHLPGTAMMDFLSKGLLIRGLLVVIPAAVPTGLRALFVSKKVNNSGLAGDPITGSHTGESVRPVILQTQGQEETMTITAKYSGKCMKCGGHISAGTQIEWEKGSGAKHVKCPETPARVSSGPKQTGQLWEECPRCGREPVYMPLHLCDHCWPKGPMIEPIDTTCREPYRRGIGQGFGPGEDGDF